MENVLEMDKSDFGLIIARHAELQFVGFDELGFFYLLVPSTIVFRHASMLNPAAAHHEPSMHIPSTAYW